MTINPDPIVRVIEGTRVQVMTKSGTIIDGHIEIVTNALWSDIDIVAVVKRDNEGE